MLVGLVSELPSSINPFMALRFALALKKVADPDGGEGWEPKHFDSIKFASDHSVDSQGSAAHENTELGSGNASQDRISAGSSESTIEEIELGEV